MQPTDIRLHKKTAVLELHYADGGMYSLPAEFLRVYSPSAEVRGHGVGQEVLQTGKRFVKIRSVTTRSSCISMMATVPASSPGNTCANFR
jgi:DUF971 family protein